MINERQYAIIHFFNRIIESYESTRKHTHFLERMFHTEEYLLYHKQEKHLPHFHQCGTEEMRDGIRLIDSITASTCFVVEKVHKCKKKTYTFGTTRVAITAGFSSSTLFLKPNAALDPDVMTSPKKVT